MRTIIMLVFVLFLTGAVQAQVGSSISSDGTTPNDNAMLDVQSPSTGDGKGILIPRVTLAQRTTSNAALDGGLLDGSGNLRGGAAQGLIVYQTDGSQGLYFNTSQTATPTWVYLGNSTTNYLPLTGGTMSGALNMGAQIITNVAHIDFDGINVSVGRSANGTNYGVAVGYQANGSKYGAAMGYQANGFDNGAAVGREANGSDYGAAVGYQANGYNYGAAVGTEADGTFSGTAVGEAANGANYGVAIGMLASGANSNVAIGTRTMARGANSIAIGHCVDNLLPDTARIRGTLYLDGGTGINYRAEFGSGSWSNKAFEINHPLDPKNKILRHFCMEGPQVWNVYAGNVQLENGFAVVELPDYYSALNLVGSEIYSLTPVGGWAPLWVNNKVADNKFVIAGQADLEISWTIKVLRNDPGCLEDLRHRPVEQLKSEIK